MATVQRKPIPPEKRDAWYAARLKHGGYIDGKEQPDHYIWRSMLARCNNPNDRSFNHYGGRGIRVCARWKSYEHFLADMGPRPDKSLTLDRIDVNGDYEPSNCRWATLSVQQQNKTSTRRYTDGSFVGTLSECAALLGISKELAHWRWKIKHSFCEGKLWQELPKPL